MRARTSNVEIFYFLKETHSTSMYICMLHQNQLLCQQVAIIIMQIDNIAITIPIVLIRIETSLGLETRPRTSKISTFL